MVSKDGVVTQGEGAGEEAQGGKQVNDETHAPEPPGALPAGGAAARAEAGARPEAGGHRWQLVLLRHGVTEYTETYRIDGRGGSNPPLSALGERQAARAAEELGRLLAEPATQGRVRVVTSSLERARQTGGGVAAALGLEAGQDARFDEQAFGEWDGLSWREVDEQGHGLARAFAQDPGCVVPGGETHQEVALRVLEGLQALGRTAVEEELHTIVVAAHRIAIMTALESVLGMGYPRSWALGQHPAAFHTLEFVGPDVPGGFVELSGLNVRNHLEGLPAR